MEMEVDGDVSAPPQGGAPPGEVKCPYCPLRVKSLDRHTMREAQGWSQHGSHCLPVPRGACFP